MTQLELANRDSDLSVEVSLDRVSKELGQQFILGDEPASEFAYLAALTLETRGNSQYDIEDTIVEFLRESGDIDLTESQCDTIEGMLK